MSAIPGPYDGELPEWAAGAAPLPIARPPHEELTGLRADFPQFRIWREMTLDRIRYVSRGCTTTCSRTPSSPRIPPNCAKSCERPRTQSGEH